MKKNASLLDVVSAKMKSSPLLPHLYFFNHEDFNSGCVVGFSHKAFFKSYKSSCWEDVTDNVLEKYDIKNIDFFKGKKGVLIVKRHDYNDYHNQETFEYYKFIIQ